MEFKGSSMKKRILLKGPLLTRSGYGEQARFALRALRSREDLFEIFIQPLSWGKTSWSVQMNEERSWIDATIEKTIKTQLKYFKIKILKAFYKSARKPTNRY